MSRRLQKGTLWLAFFAFVPVPFILAATGFAPPLRVFFLASLLGAVAIADGAQGPMPIFLGILFSQVAIFGALAYGAASGVLRLFAWLAPARLAWPLVAATFVSLLGLSLFEIYQTPHSSSGPYANWTGLFD